MFIVLLFLLWGDQGRDKEEIGKERKNKITKEMKEAITSKFQDLKDLIEIEAGEHQVVIRLMGDDRF